MNPLTLKLPSMAYSTLFAWIAVSLAGCASTVQAPWKTGWVESKVAGADISPEKVACATGKTRKEIDQTTWVTITVTHLRSVRSVTLPADSSFVPRAGERVWVDVAGCRITQH